MQTTASRDILEAIERQVFGKLGDDQLSKYAGSGETAAPRTRRRVRGRHTVAAMRAGVLGQNVDVKLKPRRDELQQPCLILANASLGFSAVRADLVGLGHVVLDANLRQAIVIKPV
jgi:hypothetical protein